MQTNGNKEINNTISMKEDTERAEKVKRLIEDANKREKRLNYATKSKEEEFVIGALQMFIIMVFFIIVFFSFKQGS